MAEERIQSEGAHRIDWLENGLRTILQQAGAKLIEALLNDPGMEIPGDVLQTGEKRRRNQKKNVLTLFGPITLNRTAYYRYETGTSRFPLDEALELLEGATPAAAKLICRSACREPYQIASEDLEVYSGLQVNARRIQRMVQRIGPVFDQNFRKEMHTPSVEAPARRLYISGDGSGIPLRKEELKGRRGKQTDGSCKTHEVKIGCVFSQHPRDGESPLRDPGSTTYVATVKRTGPFGEELLAEARRRHLGAAQESVYISDGAKWLVEIARTHFPEATRILDFYHAMEHMHALADTVFGKDTPAAKTGIKRWKSWLLKDRVASVIKQARKGATPKNKDEVEGQLRYFEENLSAMMYGTFRAKGMFIGSGVIEAGCKTVIGKRLKQSGMFWSEKGADQILTLRCALYSGRFDELWAHSFRGEHSKAAWLNDFCHAPHATLFAK